MKALHSEALSLLEKQPLAKPNAEVRKKDGNRVEG